MKKSTLNFYQLCIDHHIPVADISHKHSRSGWINVECPFCGGNQGYHLGYNTKNNYFYCWRCSRYDKQPTSVVSCLLNCTHSEAVSLLGQYSSRHIFTEYDSSGAVQRPDVCHLPERTTALIQSHRKYLLDRNFNPEHIETEYLVQSAHWDVGGYKNRIIIPIYYENCLVAFQARDVTDKSKQKYLANPDEKQAKPIKDCLYNIDRAVSGAIVVVEGVTDVWRLGRGSVALFGLSWNPAQIKQIKKFERKYIMMDIDGKEKAQELAGILSGFPGTTKIIYLSEKDPADLSQKDANTIMREIGFIR